MIMFKERLYELAAEVLMGLIFAAILYLCVYIPYMLTH